MHRETAHLEHRSAGLPRGGSLDPTGGDTFKRAWDLNAFVKMAAHRLGADTMPPGGLVVAAIKGGRAAPAA